MSELEPKLLTNPDTDLLTRTTGGITVTLWLRTQETSLYITINSEKISEQFNVLDNSEAMEAYRHPFPYGHHTGQLSHQVEQRRLYAAPESDQ